MAFFLYCKQLKQPVVYFGRVIHIGQSIRIFDLNEMGKKYI